MKMKRGTIQGYRGRRYQPIATYQEQVEWLNDRIRKQGRVGNSGQRFMLRTSCAGRLAADSAPIQKWLMDYRMALMLRHENFFQGI
jgi:hypothetical protein